MPEAHDVLINLDAVDRALIAALRDEARLPVAALAARLKVARGTVQNRMARLEKAGVITGYTVKLRPTSQPHRIRAWMTVAVEGTSGPAVIQALRGEPAVTAVHSTNGRWDVLAEIAADSLEAFDRALGRIREIKGITATESHLLLSTYKA